MKLALLFFFAITTPFFVFLTDVLYGNTTPEELKKGLYETAVYNNISEFLINAEPEGQQDPTSAEISEIIYKRFTPQYIQAKTEELIDDSHLWITKDGASPVLSFSDIKEDILLSNPEFQIQFEQMSKEISAEESLNEYAGKSETQNEVNSLTALAQNDFTVPVGKYFIGIKNFYNAMKYIQPITALLLLLSLLLLLKMNHNWPSRLRWIGATLITAAAFGFGMVTFNYLAVQHLMEVTLSNSENFLAAFSPIILQLMNLFMQLYGNVQNMVSLGMIILGGCMVGASYIVHPNEKTRIVKK